MNRPLISYINEHIGVNYSNISDLFKDLEHNPPEYNANYLAQLLLIIEAMEIDELTQDQVDKYLYNRNLIAVDAMMVHQLGIKEEQ